MSDRPILIAYDGSVDAKAAITTVGELLTPGPALVVTVWHPAELSVSTSAGAATYAPIFGEIDELERTNARASAEEGAALARERASTPARLSCAPIGTSGARSSTSAPSTTPARSSSARTGKVG
jgi:hypothetical protein